MRQIWHVMRWAFAALAAAYLAAVVYAYPHDHQMHLDRAAVAKVEAQKIAEGDVNGARLPRSPDPILANATIAGIDANQNGIRDDAERAIFAKYPTSSSTSTPVRAAELQYAMTEQMFLTNVFDQETWKAVAELNSRASACLAETYPRDNLENYMQVTSGREKEIEDLVFDTSARRKKRDEAYNYEVSFSLANSDICDIDPTKGR